MIFNVLHLLFVLLVSTQVANPILSTGSTLLYTAGLGPFYNWITLPGVSAAKTDCCLHEERGVEACTCFPYGECFLLPEMWTVVLKTLVQMHQSNSMRFFYQMTRLQAAMHLSNPKPRTPTSLPFGRSGE
jgi:hypothetical protein